MKDATRPFAIEFEDGYYAVKQCTNIEHARQRAKEDHPKKTVYKIREVK